ncbi:hypothetical protein V6N13_117118 [Hibiscus sabdariffa]|uniref:Uncharacterized protein n=1 Tax=Hibiscus sabdariffa TaxID=183260 RepID=A0ABR2QHY2_9ROSI
MINALERSGLPISAAVQPLQKKGHSVKGLVLVEDEPMNTGVEPKIGGAADSPRPQVVLSFKDKLMGEIEKNKQFQCLSDLNVEASPATDAYQAKGNEVGGNTVRQSSGSRFVVLEVDKEEGEDDENINLMIPEAEREEISNRADLLVPNSTVEGSQPQQTRAGGQMKRVGKETIPQKRGRD